MSARRAEVRLKRHPIMIITLGLTIAWQLGCGGRPDQPVKDQPLAEQVASEKSEDVSEPAGDATSDGTVSIATPRRASICSGKSIAASMAISMRSISHHGATR